MVNIVFSGIEIYVYIIHTLHNAYKSLQSWVCAQAVWEEENGPSSKTSQRSATKTHCPAHEHLILKQENKSPAPSSALAVFKKHG